MAEGEPQYNIPVSSKQLIVYFVFLVIALSAAFLAGVMVGRNVESSPETVAVRDIQEALPEEPTASPSPDDLSYGSTLQGDKIEGLTAATPSGPAGAAPAVSAATPAPAPPAMPAGTVRPTPPAPRPTATRPAPTPKATPKAAPTATPRRAPTPASAKAAPSPISRLTIQVGAFRERSAAEAIVKRLKSKGYSAYMAPVSEGLFNVRVGSFTDREDAERIMAKLESQEKFKPFIVKP